MTAAPMLAPLSFTVAALSARVASLKVRLVELVGTLTAARKRNCRRAPKALRARLPELPTPPGARERGGPGGIGARDVGRGPGLPAVGTDLSEAVAGSAGLKRTAQHDRGVTATPIKIATGCLATVDGGARRQPPERHGGADHHERCQASLRRGCKGGCRVPRGGCRVPRGGWVMITSGGV